ncbi:MAG: hypothetical protein WC565_01185 [Parcubacteria group bacterium]
MDELNMNPGAAEEMAEEATTPEVAAEMGDSENIGEPATAEESSSEESLTPDETESAK